MARWGGDRPNLYRDPDIVGIVDSPPLVSPLKGDRRGREEGLGNPDPDSERPTLKRTAISRTVPTLGYYPENCIALFHLFSHSYSTESLISCAQTND